MQSKNSMRHRKEYHQNSLHCPYKSIIVWFLNSFVLENEIMMTHVLSFGTGDGFGICTLR